MAFKQKLTIPVYNLKGLNTGKIVLTKEIFAAKINQPLMAQAIRVFLNNQRKALAKAKTRGEVKASGRKIHRQKGTGRARHGSRKAPIFVKGGKAHGPTGEQNYKLKLSKKMKRLALFSALTLKLKNQEIVVLTGLDKVKPKTKEVAALLEKLKAKLLINQKNKKNKPIKITIVLPKVVDNLFKGARNIPKVNLREARLLNTYDVLNGGKLIFMKESLDVLKKTFLTQKTSKAKKTK